MLAGPALEGKEGDKAQKFIWGVLSGMCLYAARRVPEIADSIVDVERAMRWGFVWELGPFEVWDAIGVEPMAKQLDKEGHALPALVTDLLSSGKKSFYQSAQGETSYFDLAGKSYKPAPKSEGIIFLKSLKERSREIEKNSGASLIDLGDGGVCCEFHAKMNAIGGDLLSMIHKGLARLRADFDAMVIANQGENFSAGANLMLILMTAQEQEWDDLHLMVSQFQNPTLAIKHSPKPVVVAPQGLALGGGCEIVLHGTRIHAAAEAYMGLVEAGVGLIPAGGGTKEMIIRANERAEGEEDLDLFHALKPVFENIAMAKVSTSGEEARELGYLGRAALTSSQLVSQQYLLDLEREAFVSLCGERKTQERIAHTLKTGKPLRN